MNIVNVITDDSVMVLNTSTGEQVKFFSGDSRYDSACEMIQAGTLEAVFALDTKHVVSNFFYNGEADNVSVKIVDGVGKVTLHNFGNMVVDLHPTITNKIIKMAAGKFEPTSLLNFINNLYSNPSKSAVDEIFLFAEQAELPITEDGCLIAYKIVRSDYKDIYTGTMDNSVGKVLSMPRHMVDDKRENTCSQGLHFCSRGYLPCYASNSSTDRCILVKINPADIVSIPNDYNNAKGRTWKYEVVGEMPAGWRSTLVNADFTDDPVVSTTGGKVYSVHFSRGYNDGKNAALDGEPFEPALLSDDPDEIEYNQGYDDGYFEYN